MPHSKPASEKRLTTGLILVVTGIVTAIVVLAVMLTSSLQPDYRIAVVTPLGLSDQSVQNLKNALVLYAEDANEDGQVILDVINIAMEDTSVTKNAQQALREAVSSDNTFLFLTDSTEYEYILAGWPDLFAPIPGTDGGQWPLDGSSFARGWGGYAQTGLSLSFSIRQEEGLKGRALERYGAARDLLRSVSYNPGADTQ